MKLSTKGRYGTRAMLDLAMYNGRKSVLLRDIAKRQGLSERYLENIIRNLVASGLVVSTRGRNGGFSLAKPPGDIKLIHIINAVEGSLSPVHCLDNPGSCDRVSVCVVREVWLKLKGSITEVLDSITLEDMVNMQKEKLNGKELGMYYI